MKEIICPLLTTNTVVEEDGTVKIGTSLYMTVCQVMALYEICLI